MGFDGFAVEINKISGSEDAETPSKTKARHVSLEACCEMELQRTAKTALRRFGCMLVDACSPGWTRRGGRGFVQDDGDGGKERLG